MGMDFLLENDPNEDYEILHSEPAVSGSIFGKKIFSFAIIGVILLLGGTFAANININSSGTVEFGQGISVATVCDSSVTLTPYAAFTNSSGGSGSFNFTGFRLSNVNMSACNGASFTVEAWDNLSTQPLAFYGSSKTSLTVTDSNTAFVLNSDQTGSAISDTATSGSVLVTFSSGMVTANSIYKLTLQSQLAGTSNIATVVLTCSQGGACSLSPTDLVAAGTRAWYGIAASADGTHLVAVAQNQNIFTSVDSGNTWVSHSSSGSRGWYSVVSSSDGTHIAAVDNINPGGGIYISSDSGTSWTKSAAPTNGWWDIASSNSGSVLLASGAGTGHDIYLSRDAGTTWTDESSVGGTPSSSRTFFPVAVSADGSHLAVGGYPGDIWTSSNGGASWVDQTTLGSSSWSALTISGNSNQIVAAGYPQGIYVSNDSGVSWTHTSAPSIAWSALASSNDGSHIVACVDGGDIYSSSNSGSTWQDQSSSGSIHCRAVTSNNSGTQIAYAVYLGDLYTALIS